MHSAVFFDVGNTLVFPYPSVSEVCRQVLQRAGYAADIAAIDALMPMVDAYYEDRYRDDDTFWTDEGETSGVWVGMYSLLCRQLGIDEDAETLARRVYDEFGDASRWRAYDDVLPALIRLKDAGVMTGIISNWDRRLATVLEGLGLSPYLDTVISSAEVGLHKPDPRIFQLACDRLGVLPDEAAHIGDHHYADIVGATAVGMTAILIDRHDAPGSAAAMKTLDDLECYLGWEAEDR